MSAGLLFVSMTTTALILGGGRWQVGLITSAKLLGLRTIVADISANAPGRALADQFVQIDTNDRIGLKKLAGQVKPQLILADQTDRLVPIAGYLNDSFGLPGISESVAERFTNKFTMRQSLEHSGIPMPGIRVVHSLQEANDAVPHLGLPVIVKPLQSQSSMGVRLVTAVDQLASAYATASGVGGPSVLVEQFIDGVEVTVESVSLNGNCSVLAISEKTHYSHNPCVARLLAYPPRFPNATMDRIRKTAKAVVEHLGLETGLSHAEYRVREGIPYLVEVAARGGGNGIASTIVPHVSGVDTYSVVIRNSSGRQRGASPNPIARGNSGVF